MATNFKSGDPAFASRLNGTWTSYAVVWSSTGTPPAIGNGTITAAWQRIGDIFFYSITVIFGSTTTAGTGRWQFSLPLTAKLPFGLTVDGSGQAHSYRPIGVAEKDGIVLLNGPQLVAIYSNGATPTSNGWPEGLPWANGDVFHLGGWQPVETP